MLKSTPLLILIIFLVLLIIACTYGIIVLYMFVAQPRLLYLPNIPGRSYIATPESIRLDYEIVSIITSDGITLNGWFVPSSENRGVILFFHGNAGNISHRLDSLQVFNQLGFSTLIIDYRGYGQSQGEPSELGTYYDAEAAWQYLIEKRHVAPQKIVLFGRSLGGSIAAHLASRHTPAALIMEATFSSVPDLAADLYPWLPVRWLSRFHYNTRKLLKSIFCPVLIIHSVHDEIIPYKHGRQLFAEARKPKHFLKISGSHNEGFLVSGPTYRSGLEEFLTERSL